MSLPDPLSPDPARWLLALLAAGLIALLALRLRALSPGGAMAAILLGTTLVGTGGWWSGVLLVAFFASASLLSQRIRRRSLVAPRRGSRRDAVQVLANGGLALLLALLAARTGSTTWLLGVAGAIAAANADTWSTEIGRLSQTPPRLITTRRPVVAGTSGAVSGIGLMGAAAGASLIGALAASAVTPGWFPTPGAPAATLLAVTIGGIAGSLADSLLGATLQERRWCPTCEKPAEETIHTCGTPTTRIGGIRWLTNDVVNAACTATGAIVALLIGAIIT